VSVRNSCTDDAAAAPTPFPLERLRLAANIEIVAFEQLGEDEQSQLASLRADPEFFGLARSRRRRGPTVHTIDRAAAALLSHLATPIDERSPLDLSLGMGGSRLLSRLVLDGVLEWQSPRGYVSGPAAATSAPHVRLPAPNHPLTRLSMDAVCHGASLAIPDPVRLAGKLYAFNSEPVTPEWRQRLPPTGDVGAWLGVTSGAASRTLERRWRIAHSADDDAWYCFRPARSDIAHRSGQVTYKAYVSPTTRSLPEVLPDIVDTLASRGTPHFKVGRDLPNLLRPDKLVVYFTSHEHMLEVAERLGEALAGCAAQGVPFTAPLGETALLSWALDPSDDLTRPSWLQRDSWRSWVTNRLAKYLRQAAASRRSAADMVRYALMRITLDDIDIEQWVAGESWRREFGSEHPTS